MTDNIADLQAELAKEREECERLRAERDKSFLSNADLALDLIAVDAEIERLDTVVAKQCAEIERLRTALLTCPCPGGGYTGIPANTEPTIGACITAGVCGCCYGDALGATTS